MNTTSTTSFDWNSIINKEYHSIDHLVDTVIDAACRYFKHKDELVKVFKTKVPIWFGDFELRVYHLDKRKHKDIPFHHFIANSLNSYEDQVFTLKERHIRHDENPSPFYARNPIDILYSICDFGALHWKSKYLDSSYSFINPTTTINDLYEIENNRLWKIYNNNNNNNKSNKYNKNRNKKQQHDGDDDDDRHINGHDIQSTILDEFSLLKDICLKYDTFGDAILPTPYDDILEMVIKYNNGNDKMVFLSTENSYYYMILQTS
ncbi:unnamed protein product [Cunninghamella blakesleeana]